MHHSIGFDLEYTRMHPMQQLLQASTALRYIATHPHHSIMYPLKDLSGYYEELRVDFDSPNFKSNIPLQMADSDHARDVSTQRSIHNVVALINGVCVRQKTKQQ